MNWNKTGLWNVILIDLKNLNNIVNQLSTPIIGSMC